MLLISILLCVALLYLLQDRLYRSLWQKGLDVSLELSDTRAVEGNDLTLTETILNRKLLPLPLVHVKFVTNRNLVFEDDEGSNVTDLYYRNDIMSVLSYQKLTRTLSFRCAARGYYTFHSLTVTCGNLFFSTDQLADFPCEKNLYVFPRLVDPSAFEPAFRKMFGTVLTKRYINEDPFEFRSIREYQSYDDRKSVNWKASAKTGGLKVTTHDYTSTQQVRIVINFEEFALMRYDHLFEEGIRIAATAAAAFLDRGIQVSLSTNGRDLITKQELFVPEGSGPGHMRTINEALARIDLEQKADPIAPLFDRILAETKAQDFLVLVSTYQREDLQNALRRLPGKTDSFLWFLPLDRDLPLEVGADLSASLVPWRIKQ